MNNPNTNVGRTSSLLSRQFADLLASLNKFQPLWIDAQMEELVEIPPALENHIQKISFTLSELQKKLSNSGFSSIHQWEENKAPEVSNSTPGEQLKELTRQARKLARIQNVLAQNLLSYLRGVAMLDQSRKEAIYSQTSRNGKSLGYLRCRG